jgi:hypothetical protein
VSIEVMNAVWNNSKSKGRARCVLLAIADHQGEMGAWPSLDRLAKRVNGSKRSVQRDIQDLIALGELKVDTRSAPMGGQYRANRYWVTLAGESPDMTNTDSDMTDWDSDMTTVDSDMTTVGTLTLKNLKNPKEHELFEVFWQTYPKKPPRQERKQDALKAFKSALSRATFEDILAGVEAYKLRHNGYPMLAHNWLKNDGWEDAATITTNNKSDGFWGR